MERLRVRNAGDRRKRGERPRLRKAVGYRFDCGLELEEHTLRRRGTGGVLEQLNRRGNDGVDAVDDTQVGFRWRHGASRLDRPEAASERPTSEQHQHRLLFVERPSHLARPDLVGDDILQFLRNRLTIGLDDGKHRGAEGNRFGQFLRVRDASLDDDGTAGNEAVEGGDAGD